MASIPLSVVVTVTSVLAYLIGAMPFGYWWVRVSSGKDIRKMGSGNIGATNVHRTVGGKAGWLVLLFDVLKGFVAVWLAAVLTQANPFALGLSAIAVMVGHCYSVFLGFKGGKAVACFVGAFAYVAPLALVFTIVLFVAVVAFSKYISLGSIVAALVFPIAVWLTSHPPVPILTASILAAALIIYRHKANIVRLKNGNEHVFSLKGKATG